MSWSHPDQMSISSCLADVVPLKVAPKIDTNETSQKSILEDSGKFHFHYFFLLFIKYF